MRCELYFPLMDAENPSFGDYVRGRFLEPQASQSPNHLLGGVAALLGPHFFFWGGSKIEQLRG